VFDAIKGAIVSRHSTEGFGALSHVRFSGRTVGSDPRRGESHQGLCTYEDVLDAIERVTIGAKQIEIRLSESVAVDGLGRTLTIPWIPPSPYQRREIIQGKGEPRSPIRPMRVRAREVFAESLRNAHRWLDDLVMDPNQTIELIVAKEGKSERSIRMTLSLVFIAPPIVVAAIEGRLPRGFGAKRLMDLPMVWSRQWTALGLKVPAYF
jgi:site-specific DNA recombinase